MAEIRGFPLRLRIGFLSAVLCFFVITTAGVISVGWLFFQSRREGDAELRFLSERFYINWQHKKESVDLRNPAHISGLFPPINGLVSYEIWRDGELLRRSDDLGSGVLPDIQGGKIITHEDYNRAYRVGSFFNHGVNLRLAMHDEVARRMWANVAVVMFIVMPISFVVVFVGGTLISRRALRPLEDMARTAQLITADALDQRLHVDHQSLELGQLADVFNAMFNRLKLSFEQATRFSADASHELKTPLTIMRGEIERAIQRADLDNTSLRTMESLLEEVSRLAAIVDGLLLLSKADTGRLENVRTSVDLVPLLREVAEDVELLAEETGTRFELELPERAIVRGASNFLHRIFFNLADNAVKYSNPASTVWITVTPQDSEWWCDVANPGRTLQPGDAERIFDRFYRSPEARGSNRGGHGLGLSICRELARHHGGDVYAITIDPEWTIFRVTIPIAGATAGPAEE